MQLSENELKAAADTAKSVLGAVKMEEIGRLLADRTSAQNLFASLSDKDRETLNSLLKDPARLRALLASPAAAEGLKKLLGGER